MRNQLRSFDEWVAQGATIHEDVEGEVEIPNGVVIPSSGIIAGRRQVGPVPSGKYKIWRDKLRKGNNILIPADQEDPYGYDGTVYNISNAAMRDIRDLQSGTYISFADRLDKQRQGYQNRQAAKVSPENTEAA